MFGDDRHKSDLKHECELVVKDNVTYRYIDHGLFVGLRRAFRKRLLIDESNPRSRSFYKSSFIMTRETIYHLNFYYFMIHPFSSFREFWECLQIIVILFQLTQIPFNLLLITNPPPRYLTVLPDLCTIADIIVTFNTGYVHSQANCVILNRSRVAKHYILTTFLCDLLSLISLDYIVMMIHGSAYLENIPFYNHLEFINVSKWLRFFVMWLYLNRLKESRQINIFAMGVIKLIASITLLIMWICALNYVSTYSTAWHDKQDATAASYTVYNIFGDLYIQHVRNMVLSAFHLLFLIGTRDPPVNLGVLIAQMIMMLVGFILHLLVLCQMMQYGTRYNSSCKYQQSVKQLTDYMRHKSLPPALQTKLLKYYDFRYELSYYQEDHIMKIMGPQLRQEVMLQSHMHFFAKFPLFEIIPLDVLFGVIMKMKISCYMPADTIIAAGARNTAIFFINYGSIAIYTISGKELKHLAEGEHFGELALMGDTKHNSDTIIAIDCCEIYVLDRKHFMDEISQRPEVYLRVTQYMSEYVAKYYHDDVDLYTDASSIK